MPTAKFAPRQAGISKLVLLLIILIVVLAASGTVLGLYLAGIIGGDKAVPAAAAGEEVVAAEAKPLDPPIYIPFDPPLVVNFERNGRMGFLQATIQLMTRNADVKAAVDQHAPLIRNNLLLLLSSKKYEDVSSLEGKQALREEALAEVNRVLSENGVSGQLDDFYFTGFVMQ